MRIRLPGFGRAAPRPARTATRLLIARHGQTVTNREGRFCGHAETALTALGIEQASALGRRLATLPIAACYTSDYSRTQQTALAALAGRPVPVHSDADLRELHYGEWELMKERAVARQFPEQYRLMRAEDPAWRPPGGEDIAAVRARTSAALARIAAAHAGESVLIVTHGTAINCMLSEVLGASPSHTFRFTVANCGLSEVRVLRGRMVVVRLNDTAHLEGIAPGR